jgi:predicted N-acyltransferase
MTLVARVEQSVGAIAPEDWDRLAGHDNPFTTHAFLTALEESGSVGGEAAGFRCPC